ncbi:LPS assembly lipoprotein LptE [Azospirillum sp.]|uniref:LPS assembly lipoprotein LptE n=1 Tax=Azospirillum sp. TaxID=34012 RepID=UPI003D7660F9
MSSSKRNLLRTGAALGCLALLSACGFRPLYGDQGVAGGGAADKLEMVAISNIPDRPGQILRNLLIDRFHHNDRGVQTPYRLDTRIVATEQKLALRQDASAERAQLLLNVPFRLIENSTGRTLFEGTSRSFVPYNVLEERYAGLVTLDHAYNRGLAEISDEITARVAMYLAKGQ